jgi:hypothetical protein
MLETVSYFFNNLILTIASKVKIILLSRFFIRLPHEKNDHDECVILGNGPGLNLTVTRHRSFLENKTLICVNQFAETELYRQLKPAIYVLGAPEMWLDDVEEFYYKKGENLFSGISRHTEWQIRLYIHRSAHKYKRWQEIIKSNKNITVCYYNPTPVEGFRWFRNLCFRWNLGMPRPHNVLIPSLMIALNSSFNIIYLAGADHSWLKDVYVTEDNEVLLSQKHFYDATTPLARPMDKLGKGSRRLHEVLMKWVYSFRGYFDILEYSISINKKIYNITPGSYIDAFERLDPERFNNN